VRTAYEIYPIGFVKKTDDTCEIHIHNRFADALLGLESFSHIYVLYWFDQNDTPDKRLTLRVHPRKNKHNPLTGVFATHSPIRPNLLALSVCKIVSISANIIRVEDIDALPDTPVIDIKCYIPPSEAPADVRMPEWVERNRVEG
jgi:tRNA-Thr(GGU) m(6)t(6)A37 methyltransferase TsaA